MRNENWFEQFLSWLRQIFGDPGIISQTLFYVVPIGIVCTLGVVLARRRRQEISRRRLRLLTAGCLAGIGFVATSLSHAFIFDSAASIEDFDTIGKIYALSLISTFLLILTIALLNLAALVREPKVSETS